MQTPSFTRPWHGHLAAHLVGGVLQLGEDGVRGSGTYGNDDGALRREDLGIQRVVWPCPPVEIGRLNK